MGRSIVTALLLLSAFLASEQRSLAGAFLTLPLPARSAAPPSGRATTAAAPTAPRMSGGFGDEEASAGGKKKKRREAASAGDDDDELEDDQQEDGATATGETPSGDSADLAALKAQIAEFEKALAAKKSALEYALDQCEEYSKTGYARKVAEMENMRRVRSNLASTSASSATAGVLRNFLPIYDTLNSLNEKYADDEFGSKFRELNLKRSFANLGVTDYHVSPGEKVNNFRMKVLESEASADVPKDTVIREVAPGIELNGNVIRAASCVTSSGQAAAEEKRDETAASGEGDDGVATAAE